MSCCRGFSDTTAAYKGGEGFAAGTARAVHPVGGDVRVSTDHTTAAAAVVSLQLLILVPRRRNSSAQKLKGSSTTRMVNLLQPQVLHVTCRQQGV